MNALNQVLKKGAEKLRSAGVPGADRDARILLAHVLGCTPSELILKDSIGTKEEAFWAAISARTQHQPVSQIIGYREFWGRRFHVTPDVLDPRPDTETLIELALQTTPRTILDLGTGSGALAVTLACEFPKSSVVATDISQAALDVAARNAAENDAEVEFQISNWFEAVDGIFDLIVSNPPYISEIEMAQLSSDVIDWEPHLALTPGGDGLDAYRNIAHSLDGYLADNGRALFEIGHKQADDVMQIFESCGFRKREVIQDLNEKDRVVVIKR